MINRLAAIVVMLTSMISPIDGFKPEANGVRALPSMAISDCVEIAAESTISFSNFDPEGSYTPDGEMLVPFTLEIVTIPPIQGIPFLIVGKRMETNAEGVIRTRIWRDGLNEVEILLGEFKSSELSLEFARWGDAVFTTKRDINITSSLSIEAGFNVSYPIQLSYHNLDGDYVPAERIDEIELRNSIGDILTFAGDQTQWLQAVDVLGRDFGLDPVELVYTVQRVMVDGSNVVNRGQQRFIVISSEVPQIELLLYPVSLSSRDALFDYPVGKSVLIQYPDGRQDSHKLDENGELMLINLARGTYSSVVERAPGLALPTTFVLSRAQSVELVVISILDILTLSLIGITLIAGLIFLGRPELLVRIRTRFYRIRDSIAKS